MLIPRYWAEIRQEDLVGERTRVIRRFGWSDLNQEDAERHAQQRASEAFAELRAGRKVPWRERQHAYGGEGIPIREEVVARNGQDVITRNTYGARCLNEPDVLFADVDIEPRLGNLAERGFRLVGCQLPIVAVLLATAMLVRGDPRAFAICLVGGIAICLGALGILEALRRRPRAKKAHRQRVRNQVLEVIERHPVGRFALYETPAGLRLLALHATFDPRSEAVQTLFRELGTDPAYAHLCAQQSCFRARLTAKPWRIGLDRPPARWSWPVREHQIAGRRDWITRYEERARNFAACRFLEEFGRGAALPRCQDVQRMHDELCQAHSGLPIA